VLLHDADALLLCQQIIIELHETRTSDPDFPVEDLLAMIVEHGFDLRARHGPVCVLERI